MYADLSRVEFARPTIQKRISRQILAEQHPDSDLDVLITFRETPDLFTFMRLEQFLGDAIGVPVDLVMKDALKPHIGERILREATPV